ncbi:kinesin-like protein KIN-6 isoform X2 [Carica papaya]|uniref:kinesin-like protein KIN-6 isoform X2 n=1 Tax=Carica papaya TaxID=3649 RepID=UPI000B8CD22F|nr:kinesin-like protein KIN-6 isoform X2 [Carica papaya]
MEPKSQATPPCSNTVTVRRNPHRKARATPSTDTRRNPIPLSSELTDIPSFQMEDLIRIQTPEPKSPISENLRVFLRIRPLRSSRNGVTSAFGDQNSRVRPKNAWPQNAAKKNNTKEKNIKRKSNEVCLTVNDTHSVTLSPPSALQELKRNKSEVYEGFSYVFPPDSSQAEVYEKMVNPIVEEFLKGKSRMLAALGPSGSGKTYTVFGSPKDPGMVPLALKRIFNRSEDHLSGSASRSFYISIFEIYSERGKGERISDLTLDGTDLCMLQSTIKGLQEVPINDVAQAESLIARAILKRATAMTNANSQSSRSQCIINIRTVAISSGQENYAQSSNAVLTIVDLAGAERGKRTGNQGARLLESNFINNTSMVFGLCLRSLLEHQKNPKKALQKHFQNSLLTRYLRDYLEGKKMMALILTVRPWEEDYHDTSYLLKQASPLMTIKFDNVEEICNKRQFSAFPSVEPSKRMKFCYNNDPVIEGADAVHEPQLSREEASQIYTVDTGDGVLAKLSSVGKNHSERSYRIMTGFSKAIWSVLKQYKEKLKVAESEIQRLRESHNNERTRFLKLEKELNDLKSHCTCSNQNLVDVALSMVDKNFEAGKQLERSIYHVDEANADTQSPNMKGSECSSTADGFDSTTGHDQVQLRCPDDGIVSATCFNVQRSVQQNYQISKSLYGNGMSNEDSNELNCVGIKDHHPNSDAAESEINSSRSCDMVGNGCFSMVELTQQPSENEETPDLQLSHAEVVGRGCNFDVPELQPKHDTSDKTLNLEKPKRKLLPASSILVSNVTALDVEGDIEKPKGNRAGKKFVAEDRQRTQGSIALVRLLKSNLHL